MLTLSGLLDLLPSGEFARADYAQDGEWYVTRRYGDGAIVYCDQYGKHADEVVKLTESNLEACYTIM
ncbi:hypothetical protein [Paenibacillus illinoisensis]|uniref:Uncharacterized protein n=1 Tax=Paenibacillus illinoisensis TaxID=59845 RepID=A0A2W0CX63_9BACL|nr:hypothetical protein [Paenibacillus illinoisensis]PYY28241.1 Uncharacterized protein PIL02S_03387 [Paenibacillus illinoisensis]